MKTFFKHWNWEWDFGEAELESDPGPEVPHAVAYFDHESRLYRVETYQAHAEKPTPPERFDYDYFCDDSGRVLEKRSLDQNGNVGLLVRFSYDPASGAATQTAYEPSNQQTTSVTKKDYLVIRAQRNISKRP